MLDSLIVYMQYISTWEIIMYAGLLICCITTSYIAVDKFVKFTEKYDLARKRSFKIRREDISNEAIRAWLEKTSKNMRKTFLERRSILNILGYSILACLGFMLGVWHFKSLSTAVVLTVGGIVIPEQIVFYREQFRKEKILEQMAPMIRTFAAEYADTGSEMMALGNAGRRLPQPIGGILENTYRQLIAGKNHDDVLIEFSKELDNEYGRIFVQVLRMGLAGENVKDVYNGLALRITTQYELIKKSKTTSYGDKIMLMILVVLVVGVYVFMLHQYPDSYRVYTETTFGRLAVFISIVSVVGAFLLDRLITEGVDDVG